MVYWRGRRVDRWEVDIVALNIKNQETYRLVEELANLTGENMTEAVTEAVRERLARVRPHAEPGVAERLLQIGKECAARLKEPFRSVDHGDLLYDEKGLPR
jgi:antitoxin VapB